MKSADLNLNAELAETHQEVGAKDQLKAIVANTSQKVMQQKAK